MKKEITIAQRYWGKDHNRAIITVCNNLVNVQGFIGSRYGQKAIGPKIANIAEVPQKLRKKLIAFERDRYSKPSKAFTDFINEVWQKAQTQNSWFNY